MNKHQPSSQMEVAVFKSNRSQAVRIPKALAFPENVKRVSITPVDGGLLIKPAATWADYFVNGPHAEPGFLEDRMQGEWEDREGL